MSSFGGTIKLTGEQNYRRALNQISKDLKTTSAALKAQATDFNNSGKAMTSTAAKERELTTAINSQKTAIATAQRSFAQYTVSLQAQQTRHNALNKEYKNAVLELDRIAKASGETSDEYQEQAAKVGELEGQLAESNDELNKSKAAMAELKREINSSTKTMNAAESELDDLGKSAQESGDKAEKAKEGFTVFKGALASLAADAIRSAISALKDLARETLEAGMSFEAAMSQVEAVSGATGEDLEQLTAKAEEMGAKTKFSATQSAEAFNYMAMAGWKTEDMLSGIEGIMNLAAASGEDLATTSDIVTDALTAMGYSAKDSGKLADVMAAASSNANTNVSMMGQTFQYAAPIVGALGYSMEDTAVQIGLMANAGIKGEKAGTALRSVLTRLSAPPKECAQALADLGIELTDSNGKMKSLDGVMGELRKAFANMSETEQTATAKHIAGQEAMSGLLAIVNAAPADYKKLKKAVEGSSGAAQKMADTMNDNVQGAMTIFKSQVEGVQISLFKKLEPALRSAIKAASDMVSKVDWNGFGDKAKAALDKLMDGLKWVIDNHQKILTAMKLVIGAFAAAKIMSFTKSLSDMAKGFIEIAKGTAIATAATNINTGAEAANTTGKVAATGATGALTVATNLLNAAWKANPIGLVITGLTALVGVIGLVISKTNGMTEAEKEQQKALDDTYDRINANKEAWAELEKTQQNQINVGMTEVSGLQDLWQELQGIVDQNGKVKKGYEERAGFITSTLSEALGIEIQNVGGVIQEHKNLQGEIDTLMEKKKAQIILDSQESLYREAIEKQTQAVKDAQAAEEARAQKLQELGALEQELRDIQSQGINEYTTAASIGVQKRIADKQKEVDEADRQYQQATDAVAQYAYNTQTYEDNLAAFHAGKYGEMSTVTWDLVKDYQSAGDAKKAQLEDEIKTTEAKLKILQDKYKQSGDKTIKTQIQKNKKLLNEQKSSLKQYTSATQTGTKDSEIVWSDSLDETLSKITGAKVEFRSAGDGNVQAWVDGEKKGAPMSKKEMAKAVDKTVNEVVKSTPEFKKGGENYLRGIKNGINNGSIQSGILSGLGSLGRRMINKFKASLKEHSPSKATEQIGKFFIKGLQNGIKGEENAVIKEVESFSKKLLDTVSGQSKDYKTAATNVIKSFDKGIDSALKDTKNQVSGVITTYFTNLIQKNEKQQKALQEKIKKTNSKKRKEDLQKQLNELKAQNKQYKTLYKEFGKTAITEFDKALATATEGVTDKLTKKISELAEKMQAEVAAVQSKIDAMQSKLKDYGDLFSVSYDETGAAIVSLADINKQTNTIKEYSNNLNKLKDKVSKELMGEITNMSVEDAIRFTNKLLSLGDNELKEYNKAYTDKVKQAANVANNFYADQLTQIKTKYTDKIQAELNKAAKQIEDIGLQTMKGFVKGMSKSNYSKEVKKIAKSIIKQFKKTLGIKSPSRVFRDEIGVNAALGIEQGFVDTMANVAKEMQAAIPTKLNAKITAEVAQGASREANEDSRLISAFKTALSQMKIELDDEVAGEFVERTVTRVVYS